MRSRFGLFVFGAALVAASCGGRPIVGFGTGSGGLGGSTGGAGGSGGVCAAGELRCAGVCVDVGQSQAVSWIVLADVEDNEFCLLRRRVERVG